MTQIVLGNDLRLVHAHMAGMQSASVALYVKVGSRYEPDRVGGVSHLIEHLLFRGTRKRPSAIQISRTLDAVGGVLNASTDKEMTGFWAKVAGERLELAIDLLSDMVIDSRLRPADLERERSVVGEELAMLADDPQDWVHVVADELLWPGQPLGREVVGTRESLGAIRRHDVVRHMHRFYGPNNAVLTVAGGQMLAEVVPLAERYFDDWQPVDGSDPPSARPDGEQRLRVLQRDIEQAHVALVYPAVTRRHPDRHALDLLTTILGGGTSSRLFVDVRERGALAYDIHAYLSLFADTGQVGVYAATEPGRLQHVLTRIYRQIDRLRSRRVPSEELRRAVAFMQGRLFLGLEDTFAVANWYGSQAVLDEHIETPEEAISHLHDVTPTDVLRVARTYLDPAYAHLAIIGPAGVGDDLLPQ